MVGVAGMVPRSPPRRMDGRRCGDGAVPVDGLDQHLVLLDGDVVEAVLGLAVPLSVVVPGRRLGRDAAAAAGHDARGAAQHPGVGEQLLVVPMAGDQQVHAVLRAEARVEARLVPAGEVRHDDLPGGLRGRHLLLQPCLLLRPEVPEPGLARINRRRPVGLRAARVGRVVLAAAHVVLRVLLRVLGVHHVGVGEEDVHVEALVGVRDVLAPVGRRHDPPVARPGVRDLLVPAVVEDAAAPVVVAEHAQPLLAAEAGPLVHALEDLVELVLGRGRDLAHVGAARLLDAAPIEVVPDVQDVLGVLQGGAGLESICNELLRPRVDVGHEAATGGALRPPSVEALHELIVGAQQL
mmetsp:Transcript_58824/g.154938  ORF Transcript_58824/g.154938 Transcript_58824/m.154938 type:complete len:351 (-) Transcript_58824:172-1224(-)